MRQWAKLSEILSEIYVGSRSKHVCLYLWTCQYLWKECHKEIINANIIKFHHHYYLFELSRSLLGWIWTHLCGCIPPDDRMCAVLLVNVQSLSPPIILLIHNKSQWTMQHVYFSPHVLTSSRKLFSLTHLLFQVGVKQTRLSFLKFQRLSHGQ